MKEKIIEKNLYEFLQKEIEKFTYYGIFFKGKLVCVTNARVYLQPGRAISELVSQNLYNLITDAGLDRNMPTNQYWREAKKLVKQAVDTLINDGVLEIKPL